MEFSNILDISSFFIGMLINLLLIALICYYFKRKYETLEMAQNEQAKILYNLIQQQQPRNQFNIDELMNSHVIEQINLDKKIKNEIISQSDSDEDSETDDESESEDEAEIKTITLLTEPVTVEPLERVELKVNIDSHIDISEIECEMNVEDDYSKLTIKQLKDILTKKGISSNNKMKKNELIQLIETGSGSGSGSNILNLSDELNEVNI